MYKVIGAGITGLTFAKKMNNHGNYNVEVFEKNNKVGGKASSYHVKTEVGTFVFDIGGHWFHYKNYPEVMEFLGEVELKKLTRRAFVYLDKQLFKYPIQQSYINHSNKNFVRNVKRDLETELTCKNNYYKNYDDMLRRSYGNTLYKNFFLSIIKKCLE